MDLKALQKIVSAGENQTVEFKHKAADPQKIMKEVVAFANTNGGLLIIGVSDDLQIPGLKDADEEIFALEQAMQTLCRPKVQYNMLRLPINAKKEVVIFDIEPSEKKPVYLLYNLKKKLGKAYVRVADRSIQASDEMRRILKIRSDDQPHGFVYGDKEQLLMKHLREQNQTTVKQFAAVARIQPADASAILVRLTAANVLQILPHEEEDFFILKV